MAITKTSNGIDGRGNLTVYTQENAGGDAQTCSTAGGQVEKLLFVIAMYEDAPTQTGVLVTFNSATGAAYDTVLSTGSANVQANSYIPASEIIIQPGDTIDVLAPAPGGVIGSAVSIYTEAL